MTITATLVASHHRGGGTTNTHAFTSVTLTAGRRYLIAAQGLKNSAVAWTPSTAFTVTDTAAADSGWAFTAAASDPADTGATNPTTIAVAMTGTITATEAAVTVTVDFDDSDATAFLCSLALLELETDGAEPITVAQVAGDSGQAPADITWTTAPAATSLLVAVWGAIHNSTAVFDTEPAGLTALWTATAAVPAIEVQSGASTAGALSCDATVSGTQFTWHAVAVELTDVAADPPAETTVDVTSAVAGTVGDNRVFDTDADNRVVGSAADNAVSVVD